MAKTISFGLSVKEVQNAIKEVREYQKSLDYKCMLLCEKLVEYGKIVAESHIVSSPLGKTIVVSTDIEPIQVGCRAILCAIGQNKTNEYGTVNTLLLVEFGSGIHYNPTDNPKAKEFGMGVGSFKLNKGHAFEDGWYYPNDGDRWVYTHGTKATMPMYNAGKGIRENIVKIAKVVFKD